MALAGKTVFVAGGCGVVGSGITRSLLLDGAKVAVNSRSKGRLDDLKKTLDPNLQKNLILFQDNIATEAGAKAILEKLKKQGGVQHVISSIGSWWQGGVLTKQTVEEFDKQIDAVAKSHFICAKTFLPYLAESKGSSYTFLTGFGGETCFMPDISLLTVGASCLFGIVEAAQAEFKQSDVAVSEMRIGLFVKPQLDKDVAQRSETVVGNDVIGEVMLDMIHVLKRGRIRFMNRTEMAELQLEMKGKSTKK